VAKFIGTSWKMHKTRAEAAAFAKALAADPLARRTRHRLFVIPPFPYIATVAELLAGTSVAVGAQNMHWADQGAWTGEVSPLMLRDCGATLVELGHSERRTHFGETDETVALKVEAAIKHGLTPVVCVGDTASEHEAGETGTALERQTRALLSRVTPADAAQVRIAYEPVWSIGEGGIPATPEFAEQQHRHIKMVAAALGFAGIPVLYGGSVNEGNCAALAAQANIDGLFIGRAAWAVDGFLRIVAKLDALEV
jgi:L-erythrulose 1-phosphate isomerase